MKILLGEEGNKMHYVERSEKPGSLNDNAMKWTRDLLVQVPLYSTFTGIPSKYVNKYKQEDVKQALIEMYEGLCCYCESPIGVQTYEQIEHLKPKSIFPNQSFEWNNLHLSCEVSSTWNKLECKVIRAETNKK
ncbi:TIGR02646 family protein [Clostridium estertheticum]|uniref:retron system putative HNH endonuclease n=1 Tax=Clostridium estertheticum TaxID=238834 RepID=UPI001C0D8388|nr:retron system putative HNH endonuclease [Clostridium estertheticum]MBU3178397.1 TIGR02646 family protein [Clostridium estertheticum]